MRRFEDDRLLRGASRYIEDLEHSDALEAVFVRSPHAHARIRRIDATRARARTDVRSVFTAEDFLAAGLQPLRCVRPIDSSDGTPFCAPTRHALALDTVRFVGEAVAMVVATSPTAALEAVEEIDVDYEPLEVVLDARESNEVALTHTLGDAVEAEAAFKSAAHVVRVERINNRVSALPLETRSAIGRFDAETQRYRLDTQSQGVHLIRTLVALGLGVDEERVRVVTPDVGGSFGMKLVSYPEQVAVLAAAGLLERPVRWVSTRSEALLSDTQGRDHISTSELALDGEGRILALRCVTHANLGAYASSLTTSSPVAGFARTVVNVYRIPALDLTIRAAYTNTAPTDAFRGAGKPESVHLMERLIDAAARQTGIERMTLREKNLVRPDEMPYRAANKVTWDCGDFPRALRMALDEARWDGFEARRARSERAGRRRGFGLGCYLHTAGAGTNETSRVAINSDGDVVAYVGQQAIGQGHETTFSQLLGEHLGVDTHRVTLVQGDTHWLPPRGASTGGSASLQVAGTTVLSAADQLIEQLLPHAADALEVAKADVGYASGQFSVAGTDLSIGLHELGVATRVVAPADCSADADFEGSAATYPNGVYVCEVEVDPDTGTVELCRFVGVNDVGRRINTAIVDGQLHGGIVHGLGQAWLEQVQYEATTGQLVSGSLMDYAVPRADEFPTFELYEADIPTTKNSIGAKGVGELGCLGAPGAFMNAVADAIDTQDIEMPATPQRVWRALNRCG